MNQFRGYQQLIHEDTGVTNPAMLNEIEEIMRLESRGVLDHLTRARFKKLALLAHEAAKQTCDAGREMAERESKPFKLFG
jgi:hypothetical protein